MEHVQPAGLRARIVTPIMGMGTFLSTVTLSMVAVALPTMATDFGVDFATVQWVVVGYFATVTSLHLTMGRLADIFGRKPMFIGGLLSFALASAACALSPGIWWLVGFRVVQGFGAAVVQANEPALYLSVYPPEQRGRAVGYMMLAAGLGVVVGPLIGSQILAFAAWPVLFWVLVPWATVAAILIFLVVPSAPRAEGERFDVFGALLFLFWIPSVLFALIRGFSIGWASTPVLIAVAMFVVFLAAFLLRQRATEHALLDLTLFRSIDFRVGVLISYGAFVVMSSVVLLLPFAFQNVMGLSVGQMGVLVAVVPSVGIVSGLISGRLADRFGPTYPRMAGLVVLGFGCLMLTSISADTAMVLVVLALAVTGLGGYGWVTPNTSLIMSLLPPKKQGVAGAFTAGTRTFGWASGQALWGGIFAAVVLSQGTSGSALEASIPDQVAGFRVAFLLAAMLAFALAVFSMKRSREAHPAK